MNSQAQLSVAVGLSLLAGAAVAQPSGPSAIPGVEAEAYDRSRQIVEDDAPFQMSDADRVLTAQVIQALQADESLRGRIAVSSLNGVVMLSGFVDSVPMIYRAVEIASRIGAVRKVEVDDLWKRRQDVAGT